MKAITQKGIAWELRNSIWVLWVFVPFAFFNYISFYYIAARTKQRKWLFSGILYTIPAIAAFWVVDSSYEETAVEDIIFLALIIMWVISIIHVLNARKEYLLRLEVLQGPNGELDHLKRKIQREYKIANKQKTSAQHIETVNKDIWSKIEHVKEPVETLSTQAALSNSHEKAVRKVETAESVVVEPIREVKSDLLHLNESTEAQLASVTAIGPILAKKMIVIRKEKGPFKNYDHFVELMAFKPHVAMKLKPYFLDGEQSEISFEVPTNRREGRRVDF